MTLRRDEPAPIFVDTFELCRQLQNRLGAHSGVLADDLLRSSLGLLDAVVLALKQRDREQELRTADRLVIQLRYRLRLAAETEVLGQQQALSLLEHLDRIGRQLGGWIRAECSA